jgi:hypothetical protein
VDGIGVEGKAWEEEGRCDEGEGDVRCKGRESEGVRHRGEV